MNKHLLNQKTALVTGASSGLGADFARQLAGYGANLILVARRVEQLKAVQKEIQNQHQVEVTLIPMDLSTPDAPKALYDTVKASGQRVDVLINNAGFGLFGYFEDIPWEKEKNMLDLDIITLVELTKRFLKDMQTRDFGYILQVASIAAYQPAPTYATYAAAKSFVLNFGEALNYELRNSNVHCTVLSPGITATEFLKVSGQKPTLYQRLFMMKSGEVAAIGLKKMLQGRSSVIAGRRNAVSIWLNRFTTRWVSTAMTHMLMKSEH